MLPSDLFEPPFFGHDLDEIGGRAKGLVREAPTGYSLQSGIVTCGRVVSLDTDPRVL